jgi:hypothetical protein
MSMAGKKLVLTRVKELTPALGGKDVNVKAIVLENNAKDENNTSNNATLLVGDDSGCVSLVLPKTAALLVRPSDVLQLQATQVVLKSSRIYLWGGKVERVGEFLLLFKESNNVSNITWVKDPKNPDVLVSAVATVANLLLLRGESCQSVRCAWILRLRCCCCRYRDATPPRATGCQVSARVLE